MLIYKYINVLRTNDVFVNSGIYLPLVHVKDPLVAKDKDQFNTGQPCLIKLVLDVSLNFLETVSVTSVHCAVCSCMCDSFNTSHSYDSIHNRIILTFKQCMFLKKKKVSCFGHVDYYSPNYEIFLV